MDNMDKTLLQQKPGTRPRLGMVLGTVFVLSQLMTPRLIAQTMFGDLTGVVADPTGAGIPDASVALTNEGTRAKRTATTDSSGDYRIDGLLVGTYTIEIEAAGFKKYLQTGIVVTPATL